MPTYAHKKDRPQTERPLPNQFNSAFPVFSVSAEVIALLQPET